ncbi:SIS domain-containing protein [Actinoplanes sp. LDG1-06]|uniref:SIS domain-containing protein n=1 Tax=Paractinoplanes ovalisporus TaxID=2810368 RepID=A0ABS2A2G1_9ACTN|nr:SIS domain-containing protein [Actinoplanes ovalisporus]MBM2614027.1 SIS domain-containing protein [Actinoplanes ovalisporus]
MTMQLERMIAAQPEVIAGLADPALTAAAAEQLAGARRIWLIGTGTSLHAAELGAAEMIRGGLDARAIASNAFGPELLRDGDAGVVISHTGHTAYARRSRSLLLETGTPFVSVTGPDAAWPEAVRTPLAEASETYTVSYTAALAVLAQVAHHLGTPGGGPDAVRAVARAIQDEDDDVPLPARAMAIVGPGLWSVTAREGALKIREGARILCEGFDPDRLLHGGAVPYTPADTLLVLQPDELTRGLAHAARLERMPVATLTSDVRTGSPLLDQIPMTVRLQKLALRFARLRGQNADTAITGAWADPELWPEAD